jgi:hypothetical protein
MSRAILLIGKYKNTKRPFVQKSVAHNHPQKQLIRFVIRYLASCVERRRKISDAFRWRDEHPVDHVLL